LSFNDALLTENRTRDVHVVARCPGGTDAEYFDTIGHDDEVRFAAKRPSHEAVRGTLPALERDVHPCRSDCDPS
jgi:short-subunit dehydrogenase